jgi:TonB family protein
VAPPPSASTVAPDHEVSAWPVDGPSLIYPTRLLIQRKEGSATIECVVTAKGYPQDCSVIDSVGGKAFARAVLDYIAKSRFDPEVRNGVGVEARMRWIVPFALLGGAPTRNMTLPPQEVAGAPPPYPKRFIISGREGAVDLECRITADGFTKDCAAHPAAGGSGFTDSAFADSALDYARHTRFAPSLHLGKSVEIRHRWTIIYGLILDRHDFLENGRSGQRYPAGFGEVAGGRVDITCNRYAENSPKDCVILHGSGSIALDESSLDYIVQNRLQSVRQNRRRSVQGTFYWTLSWAVYKPNILEGPKVF